MQIVNVPHPSLALFVRRVNGTQAGKYRSWEVACALGGGLAYGRTKKEATAELERAQRFGADRLTSDALLARGVLCTSRSPSAFAPEVPWCSWTAAPYSADPAGCRDAVLVERPDLPRLRGIGLGSRLFTLAREGGSLDEHIARCARVREDFREGRFTAEEAEVLGLTGERATWHQLDEYTLDTLARDAPGRALVETRATTRGVDPLPCVGIRGIHFDRYTLA